jgi:hypothetical protein
MLLLEHDDEDDDNNSSKNDEIKSPSDEILNKMFSRFFLSLTHSLSEANDRASE